ncbi:isopeptide-forming domain-containing fimbrial protein, partial [Algoriphagus winogradskyi]
FTLSATSSTVTNPVFRFYTSQDLTTEITDLTVSPAATTTYYVTVSGDGVCENAPGDAVEVTVTVNITEAPITNNPNQSFCTTDNATLSSIEIEGEGILWYATENSISPLDPTIPLADGATYFASQTDPTTNCESVLRTPVMVFLTDCNTGDGLTIQKFAENEIVYAGDTFTYTISITNTNNTEITDVTITDELDARLMYVASSNSGQFGAGVVTWTIPTIAANSIVDITLWVSTASNLASGTQISNVAIVSSPDDPDSPKESDPEVVTVEKDVDLIITKTASAATVLAGGEFSYTISVMNSGQSDATDLTITDALATGLSFISADNSGVNNAGTITWTIPTLAAGASIDLTLTVKVDADVDAGTQISNVAIVTSPDDPDSPKESDPEVVTVEKDVDLMITKTASASTVLAGGEFSYTISVMNSGQSDATDLTITDALATGLSFISADNSGVNNAGTITWTIPTLAAGASIDLTLTVMVDADVDAGTQISNVAIVSSPDDPDSPKESDPEVVTVEKDVDLMITKTASAATVLAGGEFSYTISVMNSGQSDATDLTITDALATGLSFISADNSGVNNAGTITWTVPTLAAGASIELMLTVIVDADVSNGTQISNVAIVSSPDDPDSPKESDPEVVTVENNGSLVIIKNADVESVLPGGDIVYTIAISNTGNAQVTSVLVTDELPEGVSFISASNGGSVENGVVTWTIPTLASGETIKVEIVVMAAGNLSPGTLISNTAKVSSPDVPESPIESDPEVVRVRSDFNLVINKVANQNTALAGSDLTYTITVTNTGESISPMYMVTDMLHEGLNFNSASNGGFVENGEVIWMMPPLEAGALVELTLTVEIDESLPAGTDIENVAIFWLRNVRENPGPSQPAVVRVTRDENVSISKVSSKDKVVPGEEFTYTITVSNSGQNSLSGLVIRDTLENDLSFVSASQGGTANGQLVTWSIPELAGGSSISLELKVTLSEDATIGSEIANTAYAVPEGDPDNPIPSDPEVIEVGDPQSFTIVKTPNVTEAYIGDEVNYTITVTNTSDITQEQVTVIDELPQGLTFSSSNMESEVENGTVTWMIPSLASGESIDLLLTTTVNDGAIPNEVIFNIAVVDSETSVGDPVESDPGDGVLVIEDEEKQTSISVIKWTDVQTVIVGQMIDYTILIENTGDVMAYDLLVVDSLPAGTMAMEVSPEGEISDNAVVWMMDSLEAGASIEVKIKLMTMEDKGPISNWVFISGRNFPDVSFGTDPMVITNQVDLILDKEVSGSLIQLNSIFEYKITLTNNSDNVGNEVVVTDVLAPSVEYIGADVSSGTVSFNLENRTLTWSILSIDPQAVETITIRVKAIAEGTVSNTATAVSTDDELEPTDNSDTVSHEQIEFEIPNVFTPNGDGINDAWVIKGLQEFFQQNELLIVNRWGVEVYRMDNYQNDWDGDNLNGGTYFYQFQLTDSQGVSHTMTGYVTIIK